MKGCIFIPAYNESKNIKALVRAIRKKGFDVLVVDDGSTDKTAELAKRAGAVALRNKVNRGKGFSLKKGFSYILKKNYHFVIVMDGDGQHDPSDVDKFIRQYEKGRYDLIIGNRMTNTKDMPLSRIFVNQFISGMISEIVKQDVPDTQCGFRLITREALKNINLNTLRFETETEMIIKVAKAGFKIGSVNIKTIYNGQKSRINPVSDTIRFISFCKSIVR